jgi:hypothetical protein
VPAWVHRTLEGGDHDGLRLAYSWLREHGYSVVEVMREQHAARTAAIRAEWLARPAAERARIAREQWGGDAA